ncbi:calcium/sodium antiporter [Chrysiogenes arsenatis]|uniref:calcium/sodium antiporter n=1 Tax=Chrysiogenes arsenatis TaxID=309797 RepID=UPI00048649F4|nr:calcium/sodium antiporter [Chrysiogenes arsenatis]
MLLALASIIIGLALLVWSADKFVVGSAAAARYFGISPLVIGMVIVGFGTSAPEMVVSALAAFQGNPGIALGNAFGSNITNIALILGITALISPIAVHSQVLRKELPLLTGITFFAVYLLFDLEITRIDALLLLGVFALIMVWTFRQGAQSSSDALNQEMSEALQENRLSLKASVVWMIIGLVVLILSSRLLVWGAVTIARDLGVSDLIIGLTIIAVGTSLPELASSVIAARKGEHDIALGNIIGSNIFNTLAVVGIAGVIQPMAVDAEILHRDLPVMVGLTLALFVIGFGWKRAGRINRLEGSMLLACYLGYTVYLVTSVLG